MAQILNGVMVAGRIKDEVYYRIKRYGKPKLAVMLVGDDPASKVYINNKHKACEQVGIECDFRHFPESASPDEIIDCLTEWNKSQHGILIQLPLPSKFNTNFIIQHINPMRDVDCFHPENQGLLMSGQPRFLPCTPAGILEMFKYYGIKLFRQRVVIINNTIVVGQPLTLLLSQNTEWGNATVTMCHLHTKDIEKICLDADIIITAVGKRDFILTADMVKSGAVVVDVGIYREGKKIRGDVAEEVYQKASWVSPVPGGCGPVTVAMLLKNTVDAMILKERIVSS